MMYLLGIVLTRLQQLGTYLIFNATALTMKLLLKLLGALTAMQTLFVGNLTSLSSLLVRTEQKHKALAAQSITQVQSIKSVLTTARLKLTALGQLLVTTVRQIPQRVIQLLKRRP
jgi:hypothetical protein